MADSLTPLFRVQIWTVIDAVDDKWLYMTQTFTSPTKSAEDTPKKVYAQATVRALIAPTDGSKTSPTQLLDMLGVTAEETANIKRPDDMHQLKGFLDWDEGVDVAMKAITDVAAKK